jgi:hypothetical protein
VANDIGMHEVHGLARGGQQVHAYAARRLRAAVLLPQRHPVEHGGGRELGDDQEKIRKMIDSESTSSPLSDSRIAELLKSEGLPLARRTVAKYREELRIPPSNLRKSVQ